MNGESVPNEWDEMEDDEKKKVQEDQKAKSILTSGLSLWKQSFMMNQQWFKGVLMITMMTTKDDDKKLKRIEEHPSQENLEQVK